jgi:aspartate carbamoyltransferase catalytic subunit
VTDSRNTGVLAGRSIVSFDDLTLGDVQAVFETADDVNANRQAYFGSGAGKIVATLFYEPSTRTRLSFEAAMQRLGGGVISTWDVSVSSMAKGESLADTVRVVGAYADVLVIRDPWEGAAKLAAEYAPVPVINAGDGGHEHPTQTLCDLYTLRERHGDLHGLNVALCGDLLHGRTVHSLAFALARFGANIIFVPGDGNEIPGYVLRRLERDYRAHIRRERLGILSVLFDQAPTSEESATVDAIYITPGEPHQLAMSSIEGTTVEFRVGSGESLSLYVTRRQTERGGAAPEAGRYPALTAEVLKASQFKDISILHPLPRVDELSPDVDKDPRSLYFRQAAIGIPIRMALLWHILGLGDQTAVVSKHPYVQDVPGLLYSHPGFDCSNDTCVSNQERRFARPQFEVVTNGGYKLRCLYCDQETLGTYVGNTESRFYYPSELLDRFLPSVRPEHVRFFRSSEDAESAGFKRASDRWDSYQARQSDGGKRWLDMVSGQGQ